MSMSSALSSAVSALASQSSAFSNISNNLANSSTTGYKASSTTFHSLVTGKTGSSSSTTGGVDATLRSSNGTQGTTTSTGVSTDLAISGSGYFVVSSSLSGTSKQYTRDGAFTEDASGYLLSNGEYLMGWPSNSDGTLSVSQTEATMKPVNISSITSSVAATSTMTVTGNFPSDAAVNESFTSTSQVYDSLGTATTLTATVTKTASNTWEVAYTSSDSSATVSGSPVTVTFNSDGTLASPSSTTLSISGWSTGAADSSIAIGFGTVGKADGISQYDSGETTASMSLSVSQDGLGKGTLTGVTVSSDGSVIAKFDNGESKTIYRIAIATFKNEDGLTNVAGTLFASSLASGSPTYGLADTDGNGSISSGKLESSTTDISKEFSNMMTAQQAYSAAAQILKTDTSMFDTLMSAVR